MINFQDRTFKCGNRKETVLLMPGVLWEFYYRFICPPVANFKRYGFGLLRFSYALSLLLEKQNVQRSYDNCVIFLFIFVFVFQFYKPQTFLAFLSFLNIVTISRNLWESVLDLSETSRRFNTNPDILLRNGIPVSHLLRIKDHWICEVNLPFLNILTLSNYPRYCNGLYKCYASRLTTLFE